jgi:hypothetical protein
LQLVLERQGLTNWFDWTNINKINR